MNFSEEATKTTDSLSDPVEVKCEVKADNVKDENGGEKASTDGQSSLKDPVKVKAEVKGDSVKNETGGEKAAIDGQSK